MNRVPWSLLALLSCTAAAGVTVVGALALRDRLGAWQFVFYAAGLLALAGVYCLRRVHPSVRSRHDGGAVSGQGQSEELLEIQQQLASQLDDRHRRLEQREQQLTDRLTAYQQWLEFPAPVDLLEIPASDAGVAKRDRELGKLFESETKGLFEKIRQNAYSPDGEFQPVLVRDDVYAFVEEIAAVCRSEPGNPLSGASIERILRAASRCCLRFLTELEKLPLDVRSYDLATVYGYVRRAVTVYGVYESARPYFPYVKGAYFATRLVAGGNPISLGAWWFASSLGGKSAKALVSKAANRWALDFINDIVHVIGVEVASIYDKDFRYRDPNWVYAAELTEMLHLLSPGSVALKQAVKEIGALQLRNEYDRVFLLRCAAAGKGVSTERIRVSEVLPVEQRKMIAERLEDFLELFVTDESAKGTKRWRSGVEKRLDVKLSLDKSLPPRPEEEQVRDAIQSLAGFLLEVKNCEPEDLQPLLADTSLATRVTDERLPDLWQELQQNPPFFFEKPDLEPGGQVVREFLDDLIALAVAVPPHYQPADEIVISAAQYLRSDTKRVVASLETGFVNRVADLLPDKAPVKRVPTEIARAILDLIQPDENLQFVYGDVSVTDGQGTRAAPDATWIAGIGKRLVGFTIEDKPRLIWQGDSRVQLQRAKGYLRDGCQLTGGSWLGESTLAVPSLSVQGTVLSTYRSYFAPLVAFCSG